MPSGNHTVEIIASREGDSTTVTTHITIPPLNAEVNIATGLTGAGTSSNPIVLENGARLILARVSANGGGGAPYNFRSRSSSDITIDELGVVYVDAPLNGGTHAVSLTVSSAGESVMATVYVSVAALTIEAISGMLGDGDEDLPWLSGEDGTGRVTISFSGGTGAYNYEVIGDGSLRLRGFNNIVNDIALPLSGVGEVHTVSVRVVSGAESMSSVAYVCLAAPFSGRVDADLAGGDGLSAQTPYRAGPEELSGLRITVSWASENCTNPYYTFGKADETTHQTSSNFFQVSNEGVISYNSGAAPGQSTTRLSGSNLVNEIAVNINNVISSSPETVMTVYFRPRVHCPVIFGAPTGRTFSNTAPGTEAKPAARLDGPIEEIIDRLWYDAGLEGGITFNSHWFIYTGNNQYSPGNVADPNRRFFNPLGAERFYPARATFDGKFDTKGRAIGLADPVTYGNNQPKSVFAEHVYHVYGTSSNLSDTGFRVGVEATPAEIRPDLQGLLLALNQQNECRRLAAGEFYLDSQGNATLDDYAAEDENAALRASYPN